MYCISAYFILENSYMVRCGHCNNEVDKEEAIFNTKTKRYYHPDCYQVLLDRKELCEYIADLFKYKKPSVKIYQQMAAYYDRGITYKDMLITLKYFYEVEKGDISKAQGGIGIIPYVLDRAKEYAAKNDFEQQKLMKEFEAKAAEKKETKIIFVQEQQKQKRKNIDINAL